MLRVVKHALHAQHAQILFSLIEAAQRQILSAGSARLHHRGEQVEHGLVRRAGQARRAVILLDERQIRRAQIRRLTDFADLAHHVFRIDSDLRLGMRGLLRRRGQRAVDAEEHQQRAQRLQKRKGQLASDGFIHRQRRQHDCARADRPAPNPARLLLVLLQHNLRSGAPGAQAHRQALGQRHDGLLPLAGKIVLLVLRQIAGNLFQRHRRGGNRLRHVFARFELLPKRILSVFKSGDCVHRRLPFLHDFEYVHFTPHPPSLSIDRERWGQSAKTGFTSLTKQDKTFFR